VTRLTDEYAINARNLAARRAHLLLDEDAHQTLLRLRGWADRHADDIAAKLTAHTVTSGPTGAFLAAYAERKGIELAKLGAHWQDAQAAHFRAIFNEPAAAEPFGLDYFEGLLSVGKLHNAIELPQKWFLSSYSIYLRLVRGRLGKSFAHRPGLRRRAMDAITAVFLYDIQAVVDAFYFDTFATVGLDLTQVKTRSPEHDLSDEMPQLKGTVAETIRAVSEGAVAVDAVVQRLADTLSEIGSAIEDVARAAADGATGADEQASMLKENSQLASSASSASEEASTLARSGVEAATGAREAIGAMSAKADQTTQAIAGLSARSSEIDGIVETITSIASQTNLLALNAAIEAARAGEQGRGFAVVAEEVRKLAEESRLAAEQIATRITDIQAETERAVSLVADAAEATASGGETIVGAISIFNRIGAAVERVSEEVGGISATGEQLSAFAQQAAEAAGGTSASAQQTTASTQEALSALLELRGTAARLAEAARNLNRAA
jgi:methyl-accepting chemotaxis protein